jgi:flagellin
MALRINENIAAQNAYRSLSITDGQMSKSLEKLSSGFRINRAADDAAGLAISEGLRSQVGGLKVAVRNAQDGVSVVQTAEGALTEVHTILQRMRDLGVQAANDSNSVEARANITTEVNSLVNELDRISASTNFNGTKLLDGTTTALNFQVGADGDANSRITVSLTNADIATVADNLAAPGASFVVAAPTSVAGVLRFTNNTTDVSVDVGTAGDHTTVQSVANALNADTNFANAFSASVNQAGALVVTSKIGGTVEGGTAATAAAPGTGVAAAVNIPGALAFNTAANAQAAITSIDNQISIVSTARAELGAIQNRFEHTINNLNVAVENLSASQSRIRDTDMALEMVNFTRAQILSQAGTAMLAQANQASQGVLQLLR